MVYNFCIVSFVILKTPKVILRLTDLFRMSVQLWNFQARFSVTRLVHERILGMLADFPEVMLIQNWKKFDQYSTHSELYYTKSMEINIFTRTFLRSKSDCIYWQIVTKIFIKDLHPLVAASYNIGIYVSFILYFRLLVFGILVTLVLWFSFCFFLSCPSCLEKCNQRLCNIFIFS